MNFEDLLKVNINTLNSYFFIISLCFLATILSVCADLVCGVMRSRRNAIPVSSKAFRRTVTKLIEYSCTIFVFSIIGTLVQYSVTMYGVNLPKVPIFTLLLTICICFIEFKSILENLQDSTKKNAKELIKLFATLDQRDKQNIIKTLVTYLAENETKNE